MTAIEALKHTVHDLVDQVDDEAMLRQVNELLMGGAALAEPHRWNDLSEKNKAGIKQALLEAKDPATWIQHEDVMRQFAPWRFK